MKPLGVGVIGCGNISSAYMRLAPLFGSAEMRSCADIRSQAAQEKASQFGLRAESVEEILKADDIDIVINLTVPKAHFEVSRKILEAGKNLYSEKPFALTLEEAQKLKRIAQEKGVRIGSAPDTFLGGSHQLARRLIDSGALGEIASGTCFVQSPGMEMWHPDPDFFFKPGGGPILDLGPYYLANLVQLLGPVERVAAMSGSASQERIITSEPRFGEKIKVETPTTIHSLLRFRNGAQIAFCASWDVWSHQHSNMELYGEKGTLYVPDPNFFGGEVRITQRGAFANPSLEWNHPLGRVNQDSQANYRSAGVAEMAQAIAEGRSHRCSVDLALHVVEAMTAILSSGEEGRFIELSTSCERPDAFEPEAAFSLLRGTNGSASSPKSS